MEDTGMSTMTMTTNFHTAAQTGQGEAVRRAWQRYRTTGLG
jgi:hypothetical protein